MAFVMQNFRHLGASEGGGENVLTNPSGTSLADSTRSDFWAIYGANPFTVFFCRRADEKRHTTKSQKGYISLICGKFPTQPNSAKIGASVGVADLINHTKFGNDRSREYKVMEGRISPCFIWMACRL